LETVTETAHQGSIVPIDDAQSPGYDLIPRIRFSFGQHQERRLWSTELHKLPSASLPQPRSAGLGESKKP